MDSSEMEYWCYSVCMVKRLVRYSTALKSHPMWNNNGRYCGYSQLAFSFTMNFGNLMYERSVFVNVHFLREFSSHKYSKQAFIFQNKTFDHILDFFLTNLVDCETISSTKIPYTVSIKLSWFRLYSSY